MAPPKTGSFGEFVLLLGDGQPSETFAAPCGFTSRGFNQTANTQSTTVPDCADEDAPAYADRGVDELSASISGSGVMALEALQTWREYFASGQPKNVRVVVNKPVADGGGHWQGLFVCTQFNLSAEKGQKVQAEITLENAGAYAWTDAAA